MAGELAHEQLPTAPEWATPKRTTRATGPTAQRYSGGGEFFGRIIYTHRTPVPVEEEKLAHEQLPTAPSYAPQPATVPTRTGGTLAEQRTTPATPEAYGASEQLRKERARESGLIPGYTSIGFVSGGISGDTRTRVAQQQRQDVALHGGFVKALSTDIERYSSQVEEYEETPVTWETYSERKRTYDYLIRKGEELESRRDIAMTSYEGLGKTQEFLELQPAKMGVYGGFETPFEKVSIPGVTLISQPKTEGLISTGVSPVLRDVSKGVTKGVGKGGAWIGEQVGTTITTGVERFGAEQKKVRTTFGMDKWPTTAKFLGLGEMTGRIASKQVFGEPYVKGVQWIGKQPTGLGFTIAELGRGLYGATYEEFRERPLLFAGKTAVFAGIGAGLTGGSAVLTTHVPSAAGAVKAGTILGGTALGMFYGKSAYERVKAEPEGMPRAEKVGEIVVGEVTPMVVGGYVGMKVGGAFGAKYYAKYELKQMIKKLPTQERIIAQQKLEAAKVLGKSKLPVKELSFKGMEKIPPRARPVIKKWLLEQRDTVVGGSAGVRTQMKTTMKAPRDVDIYVRKGTEIPKARELAGLLRQKGVKRVSMPKGSQITIKGQKAIEFHTLNQLYYNIKQVAPMWKPSKVYTRKTPSGIRVLDVGIQAQRKAVAGFIQKRPSPSDISHYNSIMKTLTVAAKQEARRSGIFTKWRVRAIEKIETGLVSKKGALRIPVKVPKTASQIVSKVPIAKTYYAPYSPYPSTKGFVPYAPYYPKPKEKPYAPPPVVPARYPVPVTYPKAPAPYPPIPPTPKTPPYSPPYTPPSYPTTYPPPRTPTYTPPYAPPYFPPTKTPRTIKPPEIHFETKFAYLGPQMKKQPRRYTPSLTAIGLGITGKIPKGRLTGFEIRPLPKRKTKRRKRKK